MSFGQRYEPSSGSLGMRHSGRWLTRFATSTRHICSSSGVSTCSPIAFFKVILQLFTKASAQPFWCGAAGVVNCHFILLSAENSRSLSLSNPSIISGNSRSAPISWEPLSLIIKAGDPLKAKNRRSTCVNSIVVQSAASSR